MTSLAAVVASGARREQAAAFTPPAGAALWLDPADTATRYDATTGGNLVTANNALVARLADKSGNNRHATQGTSGSQFALITAAQNGRDILRSSGSPKHMRVSCSIDSVSECTVFFVAKASSLTNLQSAVRWQESASVYFILPWDTAAKIISSRDGGTTGISSGAVANAWNVFAVRRRLNSGTGLQCWRNGTLAGSRLSVNNTLPPVNMLTLGRYNTGAAEYFAGDYGDILVYLSALSDTDIADTSAGLLTKWGL